MQALVGVLAVAVASLLLGCSPDPPSPVPLLDVDWRAVSIDGRPPAAGHDITIRLGGDGRVSGNTGWNSFGGDFEIRDGRLIGRDLVMTAAMCADPAPADLESRFVAILWSEPQVGMSDGHLRLRSSAGSEAIFGPAG